MLKQFGSIEWFLFCPCYLLLERHEHWRRLKHWHCHGHRLYYLIFCHTWKGILLSYHMKKKTLNNLLFVLFIYCTYWLDLGSPSYDLSRAVTLSVPLITYRPKKKSVIKRHLLDSGSTLNQELVQNLTAVSDAVTCDSSNGQCSGGGSYSSLTLSKVPDDRSVASSDQEGDVWEVRWTPTLALSLVLDMPTLPRNNIPESIAQVELSCM